MRENLFKQKFKNELEYMRSKKAEESELHRQQDETQNKETMMEWNERKGDLEEIIGSINDKKKSSMEEMYIEIEKYIYKKPWGRLSQYHKMEKIKEYMEEHEKDPVRRKKIVKEMEEYIYSKRLGSKKSVVYDPKIERIIKIPALKYGDDGYMIIV